MKLIVSKEFEKERLDKFLLSNITEHTRSYIKNLIESGKVFVNGEKIEKAGFLLRANDEIEFELFEPIPMEAKAENIPLSVLLTATIQPI